MTRSLVYWVNRWRVNSLSLRGLECAEAWIPAVVGGLWPHGFLTVNHLKVEVKIWGRSYLVWHRALIFSPSYIQACPRDKTITVIHTVNKPLRVIQDKKRTLFDPSGIYILHCTFKDGKSLPSNVCRLIAAMERLLGGVQHDSNVRWFYRQIVQSFSPVRYQFCISLPSQPITAECTWWPRTVITFINLWRTLL